MKQEQSQVQNYYTLVTITHMNGFAISNFVSCGSRMTMCTLHRSRIHVDIGLGVYTSFYCSIIVGIVSASPNKSQ